MSDYRYRLQISPGKRSFTLRETVATTAFTMHPPPRNEAVVILQIDKTVFRDGDPLQPSRPVPLLEADWELLRDIWSRLEQPVLPMQASQWKAYQDAFNASKIQPKDWGLFVLQRDPEQQAAMARAATQMEHEDELKLAMLSGILTPHNAMTGVTNRLGVAPIGDDWELRLSQFKAFCDSLLIEVVEIQVFTVSPRPRCVDPALLEMDPSDEVEVRARMGGFHGSSRCTAGDYVSQVEATIKRQAEGFFVVAEAAQVLADSRPGIDVTDMIRRIGCALIEETRLVRSPNDRIPLGKSEAFTEYASVVKDSDINAWLDGIGAGYRFPDAEPESVSTMSAVPDPTETAKERRDRLLAWYEEEANAGRERGAVARVTAREKLRRPTADRGNIGNDIRKARSERIEARRPGPFAGLGL